MLAPSGPPPARVGQGLRRGEAAGRRVPGVGVGRVDVSPHGDVGRPPVRAGQVVTPVMYEEGQEVWFGSLRSVGSAVLGGGAGQPRGIADLYRRGPV